MGWSVWWCRLYFLMVYIYHTYMHISDYVYFRSHFLNQIWLHPQCQSLCTWHNQIVLDINLLNFACWWSVSEWDWSFQALLQQHHAFYAHTYSKSVHEYKFCKYHNKISYPWKYVLSYGTILCLSVWYFIIAVLYSLPQREK